MFVKFWAFFLFLNSQTGAGPSSSSLAVPRSFFLPVCISVPVLASNLCPSSVHVVATFSGTTAIYNSKSQTLQEIEHVALQCFSIVHVFHCCTNINLIRQTPPTIRPASNNPSKLVKGTIL
jgi:hypothetical protein